MRKLFYVFGILLTMIALIGCNNTGSQTTSETTNVVTTTSIQNSDLTERLHSIYELAVTSDAFSGTYEEWLETVRGPQGIPGEDGREVLLQVAGGYIQWQYTGDTSWNDLLDLSDLQMDKPEITISFDLNGGEYNSSVVPFTINKYVGDTMTLPIPERKGYEFLGWFTGSGPNDGQIFNSTILSKDFTLVAHWGVKSYQIIFETGIDGQTIDSISKHYNDSISLEDEDIVGYIFEGWYLDSDYTIPFNLTKMPDHNVTVYGQYELITPDSNFPDAPGLTEETNILLTCNKDIVYVDLQDAWHWTLNILNNTDSYVQIQSMQQYVYTYWGDYSPTHYYDSSDFYRWYNTYVLGPGQSFDLTCGIGNPYDNAIYFTDYVITGIDTDGNTVKGTIRVVFSHEKDPNQYNNGMGEASVYDFANVRYNADFIVNVYNGVDWVPVNFLGKPNLTLDELEALGNDPETLQANISTLYEALMYLYISDFQAASDNIHMLENDINWEHHKPGEMAIITNEGCCATVANLLNYLLKDDYDEVGFIAYSQSDGNGHVFNYIKQDGYYYLVDLTHYLNGYTNRNLETGDINDYYTSDFIAANLHRVKNVEDYIKYCEDKYNDPPELWSMYMASNVLPIASINNYGNVEIAYPIEFQDIVNIVYDDTNDNICYVFISGPLEHPSEWDPYYIIQE